MSGGGLEKQKGAGHWVWDSGRNPGDWESECSQVVGP